MGGRTLTIKEAARHFGVSERTIRRRIAAGEFQVSKIQHRTLVHVDDTLPVTLGTDSDTVGIVGTDMSYANPDSAALLKALDMVNELRRENVQLAGQVGYLQRQVIELQEQVHMLTVDKTPEEETHAAQPEPEQPSETRSPLWQWVRRRLSRT